ncbi:hypothetical protein [Streptomyces sp. DH12]|uniref:hypothetical protein n=1 Tax=Streptomyces sp. DH12 TaxID=2857010 RepID=UPI001E393F03|nr:hypothetical protein [Streptomyces sp. DH12]
MSETRARLEKDVVFRHVITGARVKVTSSPRNWPLYGHGKAQVVTLTVDGREVRPRAVEACQFHATAYTRDGQPRRTGYVQEA